jgi:hypothetical protein
MLLAGVALPPILPGQPPVCIAGCDSTTSAGGGSAPPQPPHPSPSPSPATSAPADPAPPGCITPRGVRHAAPPLPNAPRRWALGTHVVLRGLRGRAMCVWAQRAAASGASYAREDFHWRDVERRPGKFDWRLPDEMVITAARYGLTVLPLLDTPPRWAGGSNVPKNTGAFARFTARAAARYGPGGTFWKRHPKLPQRPSTWFELLDEPYYPFPAGNVPDPAAYARLVAAAVPAGRAANPATRYLIAGEVAYTLNLGRTELDWMSGMYAAVANFGRYFDALAVHPYSSGSPLTYSLTPGAHYYQTRRVEDLRASMVAHGDSAKHIWITEIGWSTCSRSSECVSEATQAHDFRTLFRLRSTLWRPYVDAIFAYEARDHPSSDVTLTAYGIMRRTGARKPSWYAFHSARPR